MMTSTRRVFLALNLPPDVRRAVRSATAPMREAAPDVGWVAEEHLHLTLKFLGPQPASAVDSLREAMRPVLARAAVVTLEIGGLGAFPSLRAPRVVWMGVAADGRLELLHHDVESACASLGHEVDGRTFRPHITLGRARVRAPVTAPVARALAHAARAAGYHARVDVASVDIMASEAEGQGVVYHPLASLPLAGGR